jgi:hypothetical protein
VPLDQAHVLKITKPKPSKRSSKPSLSKRLQRVKNPEVDHSTRGVNQREDDIFKCFIYPSYKNL